MSVLDMTLNRGSSDAEALGNVEYPFIAIAPRPTLARDVAPDKGPIYGLNRTKLHTYAKLNCLSKLNSLI